ncbi:MAG: nucleoside phosphorylase [Bacteroidetes bacterium]|nr:nucleoside phosphorylase [Bacteroidota bacterium]
MHAIGASEMIINERGAIYHLNVRPEQIADTIITVGDPDRVSGVSKYFDHVEHVCAHREFITHTGYIGKKRISVLSTGIGPDNIDIALNEIDALVNIDFSTRTINEQKKVVSIIRMGTCGSLQGEVGVDELVAGTHGLGIDNLLHFYNLENNEEEKAILSAFELHTQINSKKVFPYIVSASPSLLKHFTQGYSHGITVTCPGFYGPQGRILRMPLAMPELVNKMTSFKFGNHHIANFEMETSAIYGLCRLLGHQCLSINVIVANRVKKEYSKDMGKAVDHMIQKSLSIIEGI